MILWLPINVERLHLRGKKIKNCIVAVNGPTMGFFFCFFSRTCTHAHMLRNYRARADVGAQSDASTRVRGFHWWKGERSGTPAEGLMGLRLWAGKCGLLLFFVAAAADGDDYDDARLQLLLLFTRAVSFHGRHAP